MSGTLGHARSDCSYHLWITSVWTTRPGRDEVYVTAAAHCDQTCLPAGNLSSNQSDLNNKTAGECQRRSPAHAGTLRPRFETPARLPRRIDNTGTKRIFSPCGCGESGSRCLDRTSEGRGSKGDKGSRGKGQRLDARVTQRKQRRKSKTKSSFTAFFLRDWKSICLLAHMAYASAELVDLFRTTRVVPVSNRRSPCLDSCVVPWFAV